MLKLFFAIQKYMSAHENGLATFIETRSQNMFDDIEKYKRDHIQRN